MMRGAGRPACGGGGADAGAMWVAMVRGPHWPTRRALDLTAGELEHPRPERGEQDGRVRGGDVQLGVRRDLLALDIGRPRRRAAAAARR